MQHLLYLAKKQVCDQAQKSGGRFCIQPLHVNALQLTLQGNYDGCGVPTYKLYCEYHSLAKKGPLTKERPPPTFRPISLYKVKVYSNERPPWSELWVELKKHGLERYAYLKLETSCS